MEHTHVGRECREWARLICDVFFVFYYYHDLILKIRIKYRVISFGRISNMISGVNATDKTPMTEMPLSFVFVG